MEDAISGLFTVLTTVAKLARPGGGRAVVAENLRLKQQLIIHNKSRQRAPNLTLQDRVMLGFCSLFLNPWCTARIAIIIKPSTLLRLPMHHTKRKYRLLFSPSITLKTHWIMVFMDQTFLWTATDLENTPRNYQADYNQCRCHSSPGGDTPVESGNDNDA